MNVVDEIYIITSDKIKNPVLPLGKLIIQGNFISMYSKLFVIVVSVVPKADKMLIYLFG